VGFEFVPQLNRTARLEPGFGLANLMGLVALAWLLILAVTSSDRAVRALGPAAWKWLQTGAYVVFYLSVLHAGYFLFLHYSLSFHKPPAPSNWFRWPLVVMGLTVVALQFAAFARTAVRKKRRPARR
jgi:sulfoxide reductase heme-binding subunit YedZ